MSVQFNLMFVHGRCGGGSHLAAVVIFVVVVVTDLIEKCLCLLLCAHQSLIVRTMPLASALWLSSSPTSTGSRTATDAGRSRGRIPTLGEVPDN
jgi:hypothetical protein